MRVLIASQFYPPVTGGQERHVQGLAAALARRGHEIDVITTATPSNGAGTCDEIVGDVTVRVHRVRTTAQRVKQLHSDPDRPHAPPVPDPAVARAVTKLLAERRHDVVHAHDWMVESTLGAAHRAGVPVLLTLHDYSHVCATKRFVYASSLCPGPSPGRCLRCSTRHYGAIGPIVASSNWLAAAHRRRRVAEFLPVSEAVARACGLGRSGSRYSIVPNFVPDSLIRREPPEPAALASGPLLYAGDLTADKGAAVLLAAYRRLDSPPPLVLAGRNLLRDAAELPSGVHLLGVVDHESVMSLMSNARLVVVPSICPDACPTVILEAMASGRPVVASAIGGIPELVLEGTTGRLVRPDDPVALAGAIGELLADPSGAAALGRGGLERVQRFTASVVAEAVEAAYVRALAGLESGSHYRAGIASAANAL